MKALATLANCAWLAASTPAWRHFRRATAQPEATQRGILRRLLADNSSSAYGRAHDFEAIRNYEQFRERVPIVEYEAIEPWIERIMRGEDSVLTREPVTRLVPTSGSTGAVKFIPFTAALLREFNAAISPWMVDLWRAHAAMALGPAYWSVSPATAACQAIASAVPIGFDDDSAYLGGKRRRLVEATFAVPATLRLVPDIETFRYLTLLCLLRQPELRLVSVWHPSFLALLLDALPGWWEELVEDVANGGSRRSHSLPVEIQRTLPAAPLPGRATVLGRFDPTDIQALWPRLGVVSCWGDAQAAFGMSDLQRRLPRVAIQPKGLLATEAFVSIPFGGWHPVAVASHFFEFADEQGNVRLAHELQAGESYTVIVTTGGGLWRYRLGDIVQVDGFLAATPSLRFAGRGGGVVDLCGEKLSESFVTRAIISACKACDFTTNFAMLAPEHDGSGRWGYTLFVEGAPHFAFGMRLENELCQNPHYALCRRLGQLDGLRLCKLRGRACEVFFRVGTEKGRSLGNIKPRCLSPQGDWRRHFGEMLEP